MDRDIVDEIRKDREIGAKRLESEYKAGLMAFARRFCADESEAEALVYRTFSEVIAGIDGYTEKSAFFGWMCKILINCHANDIRRRSNRDIEYVESVPELPEDGVARVVEAIDANILREAVERLPPDMKEAVLLRYFMDMPILKVAQILAQPVGTVKSRLHYARVLLGMRLGAKLKKSAVALIAAALLFFGATAAAVVGLVSAVGGGEGAAAAGAEVSGGTGMDATADASGTNGAVEGDANQEILPDTEVTDVATLLSSDSTQGEEIMNIRKTAAVSLAMAMLTTPASSFALAIGGGEIDVLLNSAAYVKVMENSGPLAGRWTLTGITAWNGAAQVAFSVVSNRPYASGTLNSGDARLGEMPAGNYVHQLSVFNQWDGSRTRSYRVQLAQPVGGNDIYARVTAVTVSQEGVNLVDYPDIRDFENDATKIAASYTAASDLADFPVTKLVFKKQSGYLESEGDAFINLCHCAGPNTRIEVDFELTEIELSKMPFGSYGDSSTGNPLFELFISYSSSSDTRPRYSWRFSGANFVTQSMNCDLADCDRHAISFDATTRTYTSGSYTYTFDNPMLNKKSACPLSVFGRSVNSAATKPEHFGGATKMKVYGVNVYESGKLVKCFVPCMRGGIPGLIDTCNNAFVTGVDVSKVKHGGDIATIKDDPYVATSVNDVYGGTVVGKRIYLNTGYYVKKNARVELDMAPLTPPWTTANPYGNHLFMHAQGPNSQYMYIINLKQTSASPLYWKVGTKEDTAGDIQFSYATDIRRTYTFNSNTFQVVTAGYTNLTRTATAAQSIQNDLSTYPLHLASYSAANGSTTAAGLHAPMKIYGLKIFEDDVLVKDFKPFITNGVPGLIDALNPSDMRFFTTYGGGSKGTNLVAEVGGNLDSHTSVREREAYLEFPETGSGIDTGYSVGSDSCIEADLSLWKAGIGSQELINQDAGSDSCYVAFTSAGGTKQIWFKYADTSGNTAATIYTVNDRTQFFADRHTGNLTIKRGDAELYNKVMDTNYACTRTGGSQTLKIGRSNAAMRLYSFKIYEYVNDVKTPVRDFVPCVTNGVAGLYDLCESKFYPLSGGKVSGKPAANAGEFVTVPQPAKLTWTGTGSTVTLTCFAPSAQSYEWYEDGVLLSGETSDALTLNWDRAKAKADNHIHIYSAKPVYEVFNETVRGKAVSAAVEYKPLGTTIIIR